MGLLDNINGSKVCLPYGKNQANGGDDDDDELEFNDASTLLGH